jgi:hypothetical protein
VLTEARLERERLFIVIATIVINVVAVSLLAVFGTMLGAFMAVLDIQITKDILPMAKR